MQLAARLLSDGAAKVSAVARDVGYDSEAAFSRAFKKIAGISPAAWRGGPTTATFVPNMTGKRLDTLRPRTSNDQA
jgi:AraC-like DNA-binding protein